MNYCIRNPIELVLIFWKKYFIGKYKYLLIKCFLRALAIAFSHSTVKNYFLARSPSEHHLLSSRDRFVVCKSMKKKLHIFFYLNIKKSKPYACYTRIKNPIKHIILWSTKFFFPPFSLHSFCSLFLWGKNFVSKFSFTFFPLAHINHIESNINIYILSSGCGFLSLKTIR